MGLFTLYSEAQMASWDKNYYLTMSEQRIHDLLAAPLFYCDCSYPYVVGNAWATQRFGNMKKKLDYVEK